MAHTGSWLARASRALPLAVLGLVAACTVPPPVESLPPGFGAAALTREGTGQYRVSTAGTTVTVAGGPGAGYNTRLVVWRTAEPSTDQLSCATFATQSGGWNQQGVALRISSDDGGARAITVTKSVYGLANHVFNVHVMDTRTEGVFRLIAQADLGATFLTDEGLRPLPWRLCGRVQGERVDFIAWPLNRVRPVWGDPAFGGSVTLPPGWSGPGQVGWYAGHLGPGNQVTLTDLVPAPVAAL